MSPKEWFPQRYNIETKSPRHADGLPKFTPDPANPASGRQVMVLHLESSDPVYTEDGIDQRTEITPKFEYTEPGEERWYGLSFYVDRFWPIYDKVTRFVLAQIHTTQKGGTFTPPISVRAQGDRLTLALRHNTLPVPREGDGEASKSNTPQLFYDLGKLEREKWYGLVVNALWSWEQNVGMTKIWFNGKMVYTAYEEPNC